MQESKTQALDEGNGAVARPGRKEAGVKTASPRTETCFEADGGDERAPHREVPDSLPQVPDRLDQLLPAGTQLRGGAGAGPLGAPTGAAMLLEAMEAGADAAAQSAAPGRRSAHRPSGQPQPQGLLADEHQ
jgi:hypothetical protein